MVDLFGQPESSTPARKARPLLQLTGTALVAPVLAAKAEIGPRFGTPEWDRCICRSWATLHFPNAGGIRRCLSCAVGEGRFSLSPFPRWSVMP